MAKVKVAYEERVTITLTKDDAHSLLNMLQHNDDCFYDLTDLRDALRKKLYEKVVI